MNNDLYENARNWNHLPEEEQLSMVSQRGSDIKYLDNPTEEMKIAAVKNDGNAIANIDKPSLEVQLEAVKRNPKSIYYIDDACEEVQLQAMNLRPTLIEEFRDSGSFDYHLKDLETLAPFYSPETFTTADELRKVMETQTFKDCVALHQAKGLPVDDYKVAAVQAGLAELQAQQAQQDLGRKFAVNNAAQQDSNTSGRSGGR